MKFRILVAVLAYFCLINSTNGQPFARTYKDSSVVRYDMVLHFSNATYCFPQQPHCKSILVGKEPSFDSTLKDYFDDERSPVLGMLTSFKEPVVMKFRTAYVSISFYAENVDRLVIVFVDSKGNYCVRPYSVSFDGFQPKVNSYLMTYDSYGSRPSFSDEAIEVSAVGIYYSKKDHAVNSRLLIGEFILIEFYSHQYGILSPWLKPLFSNESSFDSDLMDDYSSWYFSRIVNSSKFVHRLPSFDQFSIERGLVSGITQFVLDKDEKEEDFLRKFLQLAIKEYAFLEEKGIDSTKAVSELKRLFEKGHGSYGLLLKDLYNFINSTFQDPHFQVILPDTLLANKTLGPVRILELAHKARVVANFAENYQDKIPVGSTVFRIDGRLILDSDIHLDRLYREGSDSVTLDYATPGNPNVLNRIDIKYDSKVKIPDSFRRSSGFKLINDSVPYMKVNSWTGKNVVTLLNNRKEIVHHGELIIDLRGNGGGYSSEVHEMLSMFLPELTTIGEIHTHFVNESITIVPNHSTLCIPKDVKVVILIDEKTACSSEVFIIGMKRREKVVVLGASRTMGAIASPNFFRFPSGLQIEFHGRFRKFMFDKDIYQEGVGIQPDVMLSVTSPYDLMPYGDKVLTVANKLLVE